MFNLTLFWSYSRNAIWFRFENIKWSPVKFKYKKWADLYESEGKYLYVNRGFGVIAYPRRGHQPRNYRYRIGIIYLKRKVLSIHCFLKKSKERKIRIKLVIQFAKS